VFELEESKKILQAGIDAGLQINFHGDELHAIKSGTPVRELRIKFDVRTRLS
jgi:imidazolonepropionase